MEGLAARRELAQVDCAQHLVVEQSVSGDGLTSVWSGTPIQGAEPSSGFAYQNVESGEIPQAYFGFRGDVYRTFRQ